MLHYVEVGRCLKMTFFFNMQVTRYSDDVIQAQRARDGIVHRSLMISI